MPYPRAKCAIQELRKRRIPAGSHCRPFGRATLAVFILFASDAVAQVDYVDPTIGNIGILLVPTRPAVYLPNS
jgi:hypothetical protein